MYFFAVYILIKISASQYHCYSSLLIRWKMSKCNNVSVLSLFRRLEFVVTFFVTLSTHKNACMITHGNGFRTGFAYDPSAYKVGLSLPETLIH